MRCTARVHQTLKRWWPILVRNISQILKSPPLPQLQLRDGQQKGQCSRGDQCGNESTILRTSENPKGKRKGFATLQLSATEFFGKRNSVLQEGKTQPTCLTSQVGDCSKGNALDYWHALACSFPSAGNRQLGNQCEFWHAEQGWRRTEETNEFCGTRQHSGKVTSLKVRAKGDLLHGVSAIPVRSKFQKIEDCCQTVSSPNSLQHEQLGICAAFIEARMESASKKHGM